MHSLRALYEPPSRSCVCIRDWNRRRVAVDDGAGRGQLGCAPGWLDVSHTWLAFLGYRWTPYILSVLAAGELIADKLPTTPSRKQAGPFGARIVSGALSGAAVVVGGGQAWALGAIAGAVGGIVGALGGYAARTGLVRALKVPDFVIALLEDLVAVGGGLFLVSRF